MTTTLPSIFLSHGSPMVALEPREAGAFWQRLGPRIDAAFGRPQAILAISAHTTSSEPVLLGAARHQTIHDFGAFPDALFQMRYDAPGAPALAERASRLLREAGIDAHASDEGGIDHGIWTALRFVYPQADVPVLPLAWVTSLDPAQQFAFGQALAPLGAEGVLVMGTGSITHNLFKVFGGRPAIDAPEIPESAAFRAWVHERSAERDWAALFDYRRQAPHAALMHPTDEHWLPWYVAAGAGGPDTAPLRLHASVTYGCIGMDTYAFGADATQLQAALND
jgi:4,5-DOPA dioxygenase extradiol